MISPVLFVITLTSSYLLGGTLVLATIYYFFPKVYLLSVVLSTDLHTDLLISSTAVDIGLRDLLRRLGTISVSKLRLSKGKNEISKTKLIAMMGRQRIQSDFLMMDNSMT